MADNIVARANTGTGTDVLATDDIGGVQYPRVKVGWGVDGVYVDASATNPIPTAIQGLGLPTTPPDNLSAGLPVRPIGQDTWTVSFSQSGASVLDGAFRPAVVTGGVTFNQTSGVLNVVLPTGSGAEFFTRTNKSWRGVWRTRVSQVMSQRIAGNQSSWLMADLIGEGLAITVNSATSVTVAQAGHPFTAQSVGQAVCLGGITGLAGTIPGRYVIASVVPGVSYNLTVAGWPASGSCTATVFGHSYLRLLYNGTVATTSQFDTQRRGWANTPAAVTTFTTASPGHVAQLDMEGRSVYLHDFLRASTPAPNVTTRAAFHEALADDNTDLYLFLWDFNSAAAASATTISRSFVGVERWPNIPVYIAGQRAYGQANIQRITLGGETVVVSAAVGTNLMGDVGVQYRANATGAASTLNYTSPVTPAGQSVKGSAGRLLAVSLHNSATSARFVKFFNATAVTMGTTSAAFERIIPAGGTLEWSLEGGSAFAIGIQVAVTAARGLTDNTATGLALGEVSGFINFA